MGAPGARSGRFYEGASAALRRLREARDECLLAVAGALPAQRLPTFVREYDKVARQCALAVRDAIARGAIGFDAVKHLVLCRIERRPPRLDLPLAARRANLVVLTTSLLAGALTVR
jgi:hypothetical protein